MDYLFLPGNGRIPAVTASFPSDGSTGVNPSESIWILFDSPMDMEKTQSSFRLSSAKERIFGSFRWEGSKMIFSPSMPIDEPEQYTMSISGAAESSDGVNIKTEYIVRFYSVSDTVAPFFVSSVPENNQTNVSSNGIITLRFSEGVEYSSIFRGITITPSFIYTISQNSLKNEISILPAENLADGSYLIRLNQNLKDLSGNGLLNEKSINFVVGHDFYSPSVISVRSGSINLSEGLYTSGADKNSPLFIKFSEPMDRISAENSITVNPPALYRRLWITDDTIQIDFVPALESESHYMIAIDTQARDLSQNSTDKNVSYGFITDGALSAAPAVYFVMQSKSASPGLPGACNGIPSSGEFTANSPMFDYSSLDLSQYIDLDDSPAENCAIEIVIRFSNSMIRNSFIPPNTSMTAVIDSTGSSFTVQDIVMSPSGHDVKIQMSANTLPPAPPETPLYRLKLKGGPDGIYDADGNFMQQDFNILLTF